LREHNGQSVRSRGSTGAFASGIRPQPTGNETVRTAAVKSRGFKRTVSNG
jgi:hypothetical protein